MSGLIPSDAAWFAERPHREFRCRHLMDAETLPEDDPRPGMTAVRLIYVRRGDGASVKVWTVNPDLLLGEEDEGRARFAAQSMPNPPPLDEPMRHVEIVPVSGAVAADLKARLADIQRTEHQ